MLEDREQKQLKDVEDHFLYEGCTHNARCKGLC